MRLKSIKLAGFKSFVDATTVSFPNNMTAIVGPNGCGKSNVIDAVRWVMGESSAKNLRGESMTDVIFNGSSARQPVGQASIELLFDNSMGKLQGEYAGFNEISIKRKVTRDGQSQYFLNGSKCRRRDVTDIFLGTGMGPRSYAIIEQGMISRLIESKPEELRVYLEEAAGISKYKERRRDTENRISRTQENLDRLTDIREELGKQLAHLQRQAKAAERYKAYKAEERLLNAKQQAMQWRLLEGQSASLTRKIAENENTIEKTVLSRTANETGIEEARLEHVAKQDDFEANQAKFYQVGSDIAKLEQDIKYRKEKVEQAVSAKAKLAMEKATIVARIKETEEELASHNDSSEVLLPELELQQERLTACREALESKEQNQLSVQQNWEGLERTYQDEIRAGDKAEAELARYSNMSQDKTERVAFLQAELSELEALIEEPELEELSLQLEELVGTLEALSDQTDLARQEREVLISSLSDVRAARERTINELNTSQAVLASLRTLQEQAIQQQEDSDESVLSEKGVSVDHQLFSQLEIEPGWEAAVEHVLGDLLHAYESSELVLDHDTTEAWGRSLCLFRKDGESVAAKPGSLAAKVHKGGDSFRSMLNAIRVAESTSVVASMMPELEVGESLVTPEGAWFSNEWSRYAPGNQETGGIVRRETDIRQKAGEVEELTEGLRAHDLDLQQIEERLDSVSEKINQSDLEQRRLSADKARIESQKSAHEARAEQRGLRLQKAKDEIDSLQRQIAEIAEVHQQAEMVLEESKIKLESLVIQREEQQDSKSRARDDVDQLSRDLRRIQGEVHALELAQQEKASKGSLLELSLNRLREDEQRVNHAFEELESIEEDESELADETLRLEGLLETRLVAEDRLKASREVLEAIAERLRLADQQRQEFETQLLSLRESLNGLRMEKQALEMNQATCLEKIEQQNYSLDSISEQISEEDNAKEIDDRLASLANKIQRLGAINLAAVDEYQEQSERKSYLDAQNEELCAALDTLLDAIKKIDRETRARFKETYDQVNEGLQRLFPKIFGGGSARLELTDDDLLETGVAIIARPPGKKNSTIHLLSGGEKALTAIALIFAIFELNPAPFCMLDEVDAPLDDANVGRFASIVKEMSDRVQFIYITHNKVSMEKADLLMGVTMSEPGVSRLVSVDVDEAAALAEA